MQGIPDAPCAYVTNSDSKLETWIWFTEGRFEQGPVAVGKAAKAPRCTLVRAPSIGMSKA